MRPNFLTADSMVACNSCFLLLGPGEMVEKRSDIFAVLQFFPRVEQPLCALCEGVTVTHGKNMAA